MSSPMSEPVRKAIERARERLEADGLIVESLDDDCWAVSVPGGRGLMYWPAEDRWRHAGKWGRSIVTLTAELRDGPHG